MSAAAPSRGWAGGAGATTLVVVRHGVTKHTAAKRFSGGLGGDNPPLTPEGASQVRATADWLALRGQAAAVVASPVLRAQQTGELLAGAFDAPLETDPAFAEIEFGAWDGLTFTEVGAQFPAEMRAWRGDPSVAPPGGESFAEAGERVRAGLARVLEAYEGRLVVVASHVTPIKLLVADALGAPAEAVFRMELSPASASVISYFSDGRASLRAYNSLPSSGSLVR